MSSAELSECKGCSNKLSGTVVYVCKGCGYKGCRYCWPGASCPKCGVANWVRIGYVK